MNQARGWTGARGIDLSFRASGACSQHAASLLSPIGSSGGSSGGGTAATAANAPAATVVLAGRTLALTGPTARTWWMLGIGLALLDLGYVALASTWTSRRRRFRRS